MISKPFSYNSRDNFTNDTWNSDFELNELVHKVKNKGEPDSSDRKFDHLSSWSQRKVSGWCRKVSDRGEESLDVPRSVYM